MSETSSNAIPAYLPLRNDLIGEEPYGAPQLDVPVRLNTNESSYAVPELVALEIVQEVAREVPALNRYPDREARALREGLAGYLAREQSGITAEMVWAANGSNEVMQQILTPIRTRRHEYEQDIPFVIDVLKKGTEKAYAKAATTLEKVRRAMKLNHFEAGLKLQSK